MDESFSQDIIDDRVSGLMQQSHLAGITRLSFGTLMFMDEKLVHMDECIQLKKLFSSFLLR